MKKFFVIVVLCILFNVRPCYGAWVDIRASDSDAWSSYKWSYNSLARWDETTKTLRLESYTIGADTVLPQYVNIGRPGQSNQAGLFVNGVASSWDYTALDAYVNKVEILIVSPQIKKGGEPNLQRYDTYAGISSFRNIFPRLKEVILEYNDTDGALYYGDYNIAGLLGNTYDRYDSSKIDYAQNMPKLTIKNIKRIGYKAFGYGSSFPPSSHYWDDRKKDYASTLKELNIAGIDYIEKYGISGLPVLETINIDTTKKIEVEDYAFQSNPKLKNINMTGSGNFSIYLGAKEAFKDCVSLIKVDIPPSTRFGYGAFDGCIRFVPSQEFMDNVYSINDLTFKNCDSIVNVNFPNVGILGSGVFRDADKIETIEFGDCLNTVYVTRSSVEDDFITTSTLKKITNNTRYPTNFISSIDDDWDAIKSASWFFGELEPSYSKHTVDVYGYYTNSYWVAGAMKYRPYLNFIPLDGESSPIYVGLMSRTTRPTNQNVTIDVVLSGNTDGKIVKWASGSQVESYFTNSGTVVSNNAFTVSANGTYTVYAKNGSGKTDIKTITVSNIDKTVPTTPTVRISPATWTNEDVEVAMGFPSDGFKNEYKIDSGSWSMAGGGIRVSKNCTVYVRSTDEAGNVSLTASVAVNKIDKIKPNKPNISFNPNSKLGSSVSFTISHGTDTGGSAVAYSEYYLTGAQNTTNWTRYSSAVSLSTQGTTSVKARTVDNAGNISEETQFFEMVLDKTAPTTPKIALTNPNWSKEDVMVTVTPGIATTTVKTSYQLSGATAQGWVDYTSAFMVKNEGITTITVKSVSDAGLISSQSIATVKIDKTPPTLLANDLSGYISPPVKVTVTGTDSGGSGFKRIRESGKAWATASSVTANMNSNGGLLFEAEDNAGNIGTLRVDISNVDDTPPESFELKAIDKTVSTVTIEANGARDLQSGAHSTPYSYSKDNGSTWTAWTTSSSHKFTGLTPNTFYRTKCRFRDVAGNVQTQSLTVCTIPAQISMTYVKSGNSLTLTPVLNGNPTDSELKLVSRDLISNNTITLVDWSTSMVNYVHVGGDFRRGIEYTLYIRDRDKVQANSKSISYREDDNVVFSIKGAGSEDYGLYSAADNALILIGTNSKRIKFDVGTQTVNKLYFTLYNASNDIIGVPQTPLYGSYGDYVYSVETSITDTLKTKFKVICEVDTLTGTKSKVIDKQVSVYQLKSLTDLLNINVTDDGTNMTVKYDFKTVYSDPAYTEVGNMTVIRNQFNNFELIDSSGNTHNLNKGNTITVPSGDITLKKDEYEETFKKNNISVSTNIDKFITELDSGNSWSLEVYVTTKDGRFILPQDKEEFKKLGYSFEAVRADGGAIIGEGIDAYNQIKNTSGSKTYTVDTMNQFIVTDPINSNVGVSVKQVIPVYYTANLNLQPPNAVTISLDCIGNANIKYDATYIYNRLSNSMKPHGKNIYNVSTGKWTGVLYFKDGTLLLIDNVGISRFNMNLESQGTLPLANIGSISFNNEIYIGTVSGLKKVKSDGTTETTAFTNGIINVATDGFYIYTANSDGLRVLKSDFSVKGFLTNTEIFGTNTPIKTLWVANGKIYVSKTVNGSEYVIIE